MLTKSAKLAVLTNPPGIAATPIADEIYPVVPRPMTVLVKLAVVTEPPPPVAVIVTTPIPFVGLNEIPLPARS